MNMGIRAFDNDLPTYAVNNVCPATYNSHQMFVHSHNCSDCLTFAVSSEAKSKSLLPYYIVV